MLQPSPALRVTGLLARFVCCRTRFISCWWRAVAGWAGVAANAPSARSTGPTPRCESPASGGCSSSSNSDAPSDPSPLRPPAARRGVSRMPATERAAATFGPTSMALCGAPCCAAEPETLTHLFVTCPAAARAAAWLCRVWAHVADVPAPTATAALLVADDRAGVQGLAGDGASRAVRELWAFLRAVLLHAVWQHRCRRRADASSAASNVAQAAAGGATEAQVAPAAAAGPARPRTR